jgi:hypothetical protein
MKEDVVVTTGELGEGVVQEVLLDKLGEDHHPGCGHLGIDLQEEDQDLQEIGHQEVDHLPEEGLMNNFLLIVFFFLHLGLRLRITE